MVVRMGLNYIVNIDLDSVSPILEPDPKHLPEPDDPNPPISHNN